MSTMTSITPVSARKVHQALTKFAQAMEENKNKRYLRAAVSVELRELNTVLSQENITLNSDNSGFIEQMKILNPNYHNTADLLEFARFIEQKQDKDSLPAAVQVAVRDLSY